ncbi:MAG: adenosylmethionine decarboxylase [Nanoarchaeota archaeon]|nr:adenosylmethionine decarboxylase [Nanoarchaeota archaeon]
MLEGYGGDFDKLNDKNLIKKFLSGLPNEINMTKISDVLISDYKAEDENESGISGVVLLAESHISIHTYPKKQFAVADVFSCNEFESKKVIDLMKTKFNFEKVKDRLVVREYEKN